ncbi:MAG: group II intron reverse transcriptase/maturase [Saccharofermentanales bacterium]|jgi:RNA-directed DNA polymerase
MNVVKKYYSLIDKVYTLKNLYASFESVKRNKGAAGIDHQSIADFEEKLVENINQLHEELRTKTYQPSPVRRVEIPKPDGKKRPLGIPNVRDRVVQQAILNVIQPIFEPDFHPSSYGYRPKRSCQHAVAKAQQFLVRYNLPWAVDMDLSKCFDTLDHEFILQGLNKKISDGTLLRLIKQFLKAGVMIDGVSKATEIGSPQGGVISPLLMNIYLDEFDQKMKSLNIRIVRYADDILIFAKSKRKAEQYQKIATDILESMKLTVNMEKTHISSVSKGVKYLGFMIKQDRVSVDMERVKRFKDKIRRLTPRNSGIPLTKIIRELTPVLRGWGQYYRVANCEWLFKDLMGWIRRRLRMKKMREWKSWKAFHKQLRRRGFRGECPKLSMFRWRNSQCKPMNFALPNIWFKEMSLFDLCSFKTNVLSDYYV